MTEESELLLTFENFEGEKYSFIGVHEVEEFLSSELTYWSWVNEAPTKYVDLRGNYTNLISNLVNLLNSFKANQLDFGTLQNEIIARYVGKKPALVVSDSRIGRTIHSILEALGPNDAVIALGLVTPNLPVQIDDLNILRIWTMLATPSIIEWAGREQSHDAELRKMNADIKRARARFNDALSQFEKAQSNLIVDAAKRMTGLMLKSAKRALKNNREVRENANSAINRIEATEKAYSELMNLRAPVQYWKDKKALHNQARISALIMLFFFVGLGFAIAAIGFQLAVDTIIKYQTVTAIVITTSLGLGTLFTVLFWVGRVLLKIYLSERHLAGDAVEREIMTMSYLALLQDATVSDADRTIILNSIFRPSQDGVVRDEGPSDYSAIAALAKILDPKRP